MLDLLADREQCYRAVSSRDARFDGWFVTAVHSTRIYCRPSCPARLPRFEGVTFYPSAAAAQGAGYRACKRCRPDASPGSPEWDVRADLAARAMRLIGDGVVDREGVAGLAGRLGYTPRHLTRVLSDELGAGPLAVARAQRAQTARLLLETTDVSVTEVAYASGFASLRQFNDTVREIFATTPTGLRQRRRAKEVAEPGTVSLRLSYREPCEVEGTLRFLGQRAIPGVESWEPGPLPIFVRALDLPHGPATVRLTPGPVGAGYVRANLALGDLRDLTVAVSRCRRLLDLDADPVAVDAVLGAGPFWRATSGIDPACECRARSMAPNWRSGPSSASRSRSPEPAPLRAGWSPPTASRYWCPQAMSRTRFHGPLISAGLNPATLPMPGSRARALTELCGAIAEGDVVLLDGSAARSEVEQRLLLRRGIGPWTAGYIRMRALRDPDVWLGTDLEVVKALARLAADHSNGPVSPSDWSPWRSYSVLHLWSGGPS